MRRGKEMKQPASMKAGQSVSGPDPIILDFCLKTADLFLKLGMT